VVGFDLLTPANKTDPFIRGDFTSKRDLVRALTGITAVCHLGGVGDVYLAERRGAAALRTNAYGTKIVCDACMDSGVETLVYASTWEVYGKPHANPVSETHPCNPESLYSISKLAGELFVRRAGAINGMTTISLRLGPGYGPGMRESTAISSFIRRSMEKTPLPVYGDGSQLRQFTHVSDIGRAFAIATSTPSSDSSRTYNIISDESVTILDLATRIGRRNGVGIKFLPPRVPEPPSAYITAAKAFSELGWRSKIPFEDGLEELIATFPVAKGHWTRLGPESTS